MFRIKNNNIFSIKMETVKTNKTFQIDRKEFLDRSIDRKKFIRYTPSRLTMINNANSIIKINIPREDSYISLSDAYLDIELKVVKNADATLYADAAAVSLVNLGHLALFSEMTLYTSSHKKIEHIESVYQSTLMYKLLKESEEDLYGYFTKDTSPGTAIDDKLRDRLIDDNDEKGTLFVRTRLSDIFGFCEYQDKITYGLGFTLSLRRGDQQGNNALFRVNATTGAAAKVVIKDISLHVPHYTPSLENQILVSTVLNDKNAVTTMSYVERQSFFRQVNSSSVWSAELGIEAGMDVPIYVIVGFQSTARYGPSQTQNNGIFDTLDIRQASVNIGSERYPDNRMYLDYDRNNYLDAYEAIKRIKEEHFGVSELHPLITFKEFKDMYNIYVFDIRNQREHLASQQVKIDFEFAPGFNYATLNPIAFCLVLKNRVINISTDASKQFDITS